MITWVVQWSGMKGIVHVTHMGEKRDKYRALVDKPVGQDHLEDVGVDGRIILKWILMGWVSMDWMDFAHDRDEWQAVMRTVMSFQVLYNLGNFWTS